MRIDAKFTRNFGQPLCNIAFIAGCTDNTLHCGYLHVLHHDTSGPFMGDSWRQRRSLMLRSAENFVQSSLGELVKMARAKIWDSIKRNLQS